MSTFIFIWIGLSVACFHWTETADITGRRAMCNVQPNQGSTQRVSGVVILFQPSDNIPITITVKLSGFKSLSASAEDNEYLHGFHVHATGNMTGGCDSTGGHYNPYGVFHGGPHSQDRHQGDFGNIRQTPDGKVETTFTDPIASLYGDTSIIGRSLVVHSGMDDLGLGHNSASLVSGNAGSRVACCVIGWT